MLHSMNTGLTILDLLHFVYILCIFTFIVREKEIWWFGVTKALSHSYNNMELGSITLLVKPSTHKVQQFSPQ